MNGNKIVIWGGGKRGKRILNKIGEELIVAFIEVKPELIGKTIDAVPVISYEQYKQRYSQYCILVSPLNCEDIVQQLKKDHIIQFFLYTDCPGELQDEISDVETLRRYVLDKLPEHNYGIYGLSFYTLLLRKWLLDEKKTEVPIYIKAGEKDELATYLIKNAPEMQIEYIEKAYENSKTLLLSVNGNAEEIACKNQIEVIDVFDFSSENRKQDERIKGLKNKYQGKRGFIIGTGPSLTIADLNQLYCRKEICFSMNGIFRAFDKTDWRPQVFIANDRNFIAEQEQELEKLPVNIKLISDFGDFYWKKRRNESMYQYHSYWGVFSDTLPRFSEDCAKVVYEMATVSYACIQFAIYMGIKEIYLLGMDFTIQGDYKDKSNHFVENYYTKKSETGQFHRQEQLRAFLAAKQYADAHGIKIYNATRGGKLEVFGRVDFDELMKSQ